MTGLPRQLDLDMIAMTFDESRTRSSFLLQPPLLRHDGALYGGTAIAVAVMAMEAALQRDVLWVTTQFVFPAANGSTIDIHTEALATGKRIAQMRVTASVGEQIAFTALGAVGAPREDGLVGQYEQMPVVSGPDDAPDLHARGPGQMQPPGDFGFRRLVEYRQAMIESTDRHADGTMALWSRFNDGRPMTPAGIAFLADMVPVAIARGAGRMGAGTSLDNSMRFVEITEPTEWVLLELQGHNASGGYGHGTVRVWSQAGALLATGGQTASMIYMSEIPGMELPQ